jgi:hypothetical protein
MTTLTQAQEMLDELDRLHAETTPGEWQHIGNNVEHHGPSHEFVLAACGSVPYSWPAEHNARFIAAIHNAYPALSARVRELERERDEWRKTALTAGVSLMKRINGP